MYEAPDRYKRMISARLPDGESLGVTSREPDEGSSPLRDAQLIARGQFAPFFAAANSVAAVFMAMILYGHVPAAYLGGWVLAVGRRPISAQCSSPGPRPSPMSAGRGARCPSC